MLLSELLTMEQEYERRGYRVAFEDYHSIDRTDGEDLYVQAELTQDDGNGWPTADEAIAIAERLLKVAGKSIRNVRVLGPDLEPLDSTPASAAAEVPLASAAAPTRTFGKTNANPNRMANFADEVGEGFVIAEGLQAIPESIPPPVDPEARAAVDGIPVQGGTVLAESNGICLVGDSNSQVYACPKEALEGRTDINWRPKVKRFENVVMGPGSDGRGAGASIPWLTWAGSGVTARAAFHSPSGVWLVKR